MLAFLSQISMVGKGLQKEAVGGLPALALTKDVLTQYVTSLPWVRGVGVDVAGALLGLAALSILPISVAQPIFCNGIVLLSLFSYFYLKEALAALEWAAVGVCFGGTLLLALTLTPESWEGVDLGWLQLKLLLTLLAVPVALAALHAAAERDPRPSTLELATGCQAGLVIGAGNAAIACGLQVAGVASGLGAAAALGFALAGILLTASHPYFQNRGFKQGRVVVISAYTTLVSMATAVLIGVLVLDEPWPAGVAGVARFVALALIAAGVVLLNWKSIAAEGGLFGGGYARQGADDAATETGKSGFRVKFSLPFKRDDVFKEALSAKEPLGATSRDLKITILRAGAGAADGAVALGCVRKAEFSRPFAGSTVSELVELVAPERLVWRQLESKAPVVLVGDEGAAAAAAAAALGASSRRRRRHRGGRRRRLDLHGRARRGERRHRRHARVQVRADRARAAVVLPRAADADAAALAPLRVARQAVARRHAPPRPRVAHRRRRREAAGDRQGARRPPGDGGQPAGLRRGRPGARARAGEEGRRRGGRDEGGDEGEGRGGRRFEGVSEVEGVCRGGRGAWGGIKATWGSRRRGPPAS